MMPLLLATTPAPISNAADPAFMGMVVIILLQLSQFFFNLRKDQRSNEAAKKEDLANLRTELKKDISAVASEVDDLKESMEKKLEASRVESERARTHIEQKITDSAVTISAVVEGVDTLKQTMISTGSKVDRLLSRHP